MKAEYLDSCRRGRAARRIDRRPPSRKIKMVSPKRVSNIKGQSSDQLYSIPQFLTGFSSFFAKISTFFSQAAIAKICWDRGHREIR